MDYYQEKYLDRSSNFQMNGYSEKLAKKPNIPQCKESMEGFEYTSLFSSKTYSILSYIVGGFVGSKSQMNNNKHNLSYDLSAAVFNLLNPCKYEREKGLAKRSNENNFYTGVTKINSDCYDKYIVNTSSQKGERMKDCLMDVVELKWLGSMPLLDHVLNLSEQCFDSKENTKENFSDTCSCDKDKSLGEDNGVVTENIPCDKVEDSLVQPSKLGSESDRKESEVDVTDSGNLKVFAADECENPIGDADSGTTVRDTPRHSVNFLGAERFRQHSECSVESTDSESFIVFDDEDQDEGCCLKFGDEELDSEEENVDEDSSCDDYDFYSVDKELAEANDKWEKSYKDVEVGETEGQRKVRFNDKVKVNKIVAWDFAYRAARPGHWEEMARDRVRFQERILRLSSTISPILRKEHRDKIYKELYS